MGRESWAGVRGGTGRDAPERVQRQLMQRRGPLVARRRHRVVEEERALREAREQWLPQDRAVFCARLHSHIIQQRTRSKMAYE